MKINIQRQKNRLLIENAGYCALALLMTMTLAGCNSGTGTGGGSSSSAVSVKPAKLSGIVLNINGPVLNGVVEVTDAKKSLVATAQLSNSNHYTITIPATAAYPVVLTAKPKDGGSEVRAVVTASIAEKMDITTVSTLVVDNAMEMGGLTPENLAKASFGAIGQRQSTGVSAGAGGSTGGPGNSGGGLGRGGHGGHDMSAMGGGNSTETDGDMPATHKMSH